VNVNPIYGSFYFVFLTIEAMILLNIFLFYDNEMDNTF